MIGGGTRVSTRKHVSGVPNNEVSSQIDCSINNRTRWFFQDFETKIHKTECIAMSNVLYFFVTPPDIVSQIVI